MGAQQSRWLVVVAWATLGWAGTANSLPPPLRFEHFPPDWLGTVAQQDASGFLFAGSTTSPLGDADIWLMRTDADGRLLSEFVVGNRLFQTPVDVLPRPDGSLVIVGHADPEPGPFGEPWILGLDPAGQVLFERTVPATSTGVIAQGLGALTSAGNVVMSWQEGQPSVATVIASFGPTGDPRWALSTNDPSSGSSSPPVAAHPQGGVVTVLHTSANPAGWPSAVPAVVVRLAEDGTVAGQTIVSFGRVTRATHLAVAPDGSVVVVGQAGEGLGNALEDAFVAWLDAAGQLVASRVLGTPVAEQARSVRLLADGGVLVVGGTYRKAEWLLRFDAAHALAWQRRLPRDRMHPSADVRAVDSGGFVLAGSLADAPGGERLALILGLGEDGLPLVPCDLITDGDLVPVPHAALSDVGTMSFSPATVVTVPGTSVRRDLSAPELSGACTP